MFNIESEIRIRRPLSIVELIQRQEQEKEWIELFQFQKKFRESRNITAPGLLRKLDLPITLSKLLYYDYCSAERRTPELVQKLKALRNSPDSFSDMGSYVGDTYEEHLCNFFAQYRDQLKNVSIDGVRVEKKDGDESLEIILDVLGNDMTEEQIVTNFRQLLDKTNLNTIQPLGIIKINRWYV